MKNLRTNSNHLKSPPTPFPKLMSKMSPAHCTKNEELHNGKLHFLCSVHWESLFCHLEIEMYLEKIQSFIVGNHLNACHCSVFCCLYCLFFKENTRLQVRKAAFIYQKQSPDGALLGSYSEKLNSFSKNNRKLTCNFTKEPSSQVPSYNIYSVSQDTIPQKQFWTKIFFLEFIHLTFIAFLG